MINLSIFFGNIMLPWIWVFNWGCTTSISDLGPWSPWTFLTLGSRDVCLGGCGMAFQGLGERYEPRRVGRAEDGEVWGYICHEGMKLVEWQVFFLKMFQRKNLEPFRWRRIFSSAAACQGLEETWIDFKGPVYLNLSWNCHEIDVAKGTGLVTSCDNFNRLFLTETVKAKAGELSPDIMQDHVEANLIIFGDTGLLKSWHLMACLEFCTLDVDDNC